MALPVLPPAPTNPQTRPKDRLLTKGTMENSAPAAPCKAQSHWSFSSGLEVSRKVWHSAHQPYTECVEHCRGQTAMVGWL